MVSLRARLIELEGLVQCAHRLLDVVAGDVEGNLDRRRGDEMRLDADAGERPEGLRRDARVTLHPGTDDADLAEAFALVPLTAQAGERGLGSLPILLRSREDHPVADLDDRVD